MEDVYERWNDDGWLGGFELKKSSTVSPGYSIARKLNNSYTEEITVECTERTFVKKSDFSRSPLSKSDFLNKSSVSKVR